MVMIFVYRAQASSKQISEKAQQLRLLADAMPQLVWMTDIEGEVEYFNKRWLEYTGFTGTKPAQIPWLETVHPDDRDRVKELHSEAIRSRSTFSVEYRLRNAAGEYRWHLARTVYARDAAGRPMRRFGTATDIHDYQVILAKLAETRARFDAALQGTNESVFIVDREWKVLLVSDVACRILNRNRDEVMGKSIWQVFPEIIGTRAEHEFTRAMTKRRSVHFELLSPLTERWKEIRAVPFEDGLMAFVSDVHDRRLAEGKAQAAAHQMQTIADAAPAAIMYVDARERYIFANRYYEVHLGRMLTDIMGKPMREILGEEQYRQVRPHIQSVLRGKTTFFEVKVTHPSGSQAMMESTYSPHFGPNGEVLGFVAISQDVSRLRRAEAEVAERERLLRMITDQMMSFVSYIDVEGRFIFANRFYEDWFGIKQEELRGKTRMDLMGETGAYSKMREYEERAAKGERVRFEHTMTHRMGHTRHLDVEFIPDREPATGDVRGIICVANDVTTRMLTMRELQKAIQARDEFLSVASHELRTPLTSMKLQAQMLKRALDRGDQTLLSSGRIAKFLDQSNRGIERMSHLIEDMLDISRIQTGRLMIHREACDFFELVTETIERFQPEFQRAGIECRFKGEPGFMVDVDLFRMEQVLTNLITNACRYAGGQPVHISLERREKRMVFRFRDHGPGIAKEDRERIFRRFERLVSANEVSGLGIGLFIVKEIVQAHGGSITVESQPGDGAAFVIDLPLKKAIQEIAQAKEVSAGPSGA